MAETNKQTNPFAEHGYPPELLDIAARALKRGPRGQGVDQTVVYEGEQAILPKGTTVHFGERQREIITALVDNARGEESARSVGFGVMSVMIRSAYELPESHGYYPEGWGYYAVEGSGYFDKLAALRDIAKKDQ